MSTLEYITSERFIHDGLCRDVIGGFDTLHERWSDEGAITPFCLIWPGKAFTDDDGIPREGVVEIELPEERGEWEGCMEDAIQRVNGYAILLCEQRVEDVRVLLESKHGTRTWLFPIEDLGDRSSLGKPAASDDSDLLGLFWKPKGQS